MDICLLLCWMKYHYLYHSYSLKQKTIHLLICLPNFSYDIKQSLIIILTIHNILYKNFRFNVNNNSTYFIQTNNVFRYSPPYYKWRTLESLCFSLQSIPWTTLLFDENNLINTSRPTNSIICWKAPQWLNLLCNPWDATEIVSYHKKNYIWVKNLWKFDEDLRNAVTAIKIYFHSREIWG